MRKTRKLILTVVGVTLVSVIVSIAVSELAGFAIGITPDWRQFVLTLLVPAIVTPVWALPLVKANQQSAQIQGKLRRLAHIDSLSGLPNRRAFFDRARTILREADEKGLPVAIMMVDVDCFKEINDTHGHDIGDAVIRAVAGALQRAVASRVTSARDSVVARVGGEEFAVLVARLSEPRACALAEDICKTVRQLASSSDELSLMVTVSVGVAARGPGESIDAVLKFADNAVYVAKHAGRNQWHIATGGREPLRHGPHHVNDKMHTPAVRAVNG